MSAPLWVATPLLLPPVFSCFLLFLPPFALRADAYDVSTSLTGYEPNYMAFSELSDSQGSFSYITPSSDQDMDDVTLGKLLTEAHRGQADYCEPEGVSVSQSSSVVFDRAVKPAGERDVDHSVGFGVTRNMHSVHGKFSQHTQTEKVVEWSGKLEERESSSAQIRTSLDEQRQMIIAEHCEKIGHHEFQAAHAEEERRVPREESCRQNVIFWSSSIKFNRDGENYEHSKSLPSQHGSSSRTRTPLEFSSSVQEVNCMNDSKDFQDVESIRNGNSHVTSRPVSFPPHPIPEGMLCRSIGKPSRREGPPSIRDTHGISGNVFSNSKCVILSTLSSRIESRFVHPQWKRVKGEHQFKIWDASLDRQPEIQSSLVEEALQIIMDKVQDRNTYLFTISYGSDAMDQRSGVGWFSGWIEIFVIYSWCFKCRIWNTRCQDRFSAEQNHP